MKRSKEKFLAQEAIHVKIEGNPSRTVLFFVNSVSYPYLSAYPVSEVRILFVIIIVRAQEIGLDVFFLKNDQKLTPHRFVHRHLSYLSVLESFHARLYNIWRNFVEICRAWSKRWSDPWFINEKLISWFVFRHQIQWFVNFSWRS